MAKQRDERGVALVEFALITPILFAVLLGIFSGGQAYNRQVTLTDAAREGARYGATLAAEPSPLTACTIGNTLPSPPVSWCDRVRTRVVELSGGLLTASQVCADLVDNPDTSSQPAGCSNTNKPANPTDVTVGQRKVVKVWVARTSDFQALIYKRTLTLTARMAAHYEQP